jgi:hypothetical protein
MNDPTKTVGPPLTPLPARKSRGVLEKVLDNADVVIDGTWHFIYAQCTRRKTEAHNKSVKSAMTSTNIIAFSRV